MGVVWQEKDGELVEGAGNDRGGGGRWREQGMIEEMEGGGERLWLSVSALGCLWRTEVCTERQSNLKVACSVSVKITLQSFYLSCFVQWCVCVHSQTSFNPPPLLYLSLSPPTHHGGPFSVLLLLPPCPTQFVHSPLLLDACMACVGPDNHIASPSVVCVCALLPSPV